MGTLRLLGRLLGYVRCLVPWCAVLVVTALLCGEVLAHHVPPGHLHLPAVATFCRALPVATDTISADTPYCVTDQSGATMVIMVDRAASLFPPMLKVVATPGPTATLMPGLAAMPTANGNFTGSGMAGPPH